jgi:hypothetical protein
MDAETKEAYLLPLQWQTQSFMPVLKAEGCAVYKGNRKLTSNLHMSALEAWNEQEAKDYLFKRHGITDCILHTIYWQSMRYALKQLSPHRRATALKHIHRHLPTQAKLFQQGRVTMTSICPRCLKSDETNAHVYCCTATDAVKQRKADWLELWKQLRRSNTAAIIEATWRHYLSPIVDIPLGNSIVDSFPIVHGELSDLLQQAIQEQEIIGWEKLLVGMGTVVWKSIQDLFDHDNPKPPKRSASAWMNSAIHQLLKFSMRCWKARNQTVHGATWQEQRTIALQQAREQITEIYRNPPKLAHHFRSIFEIPLEHRLKLPLNAAEQWLAQIAHQVRVTQHNFKLLTKKDKSIPTHFRTMRREARQQAKDRTLPDSPSRAHSRAVQSAVRAMKDKLYAPKAKKTKHPKPQRKPRSKKKTGKLQREDSKSSSRATTTATTSARPLRPHPP